MIVRRDVKGDAPSIATYSDDEAYRYDLRRSWAPGAGRIAFVMLNPSTATEARNDPTVERCERRARALGYGEMGVANIFALRATDPRVMRAHPDPVGGADNDAAIVALADWADAILCAWGSHGDHLGRGAAVHRMLHGRASPLTVLGLTKGGHPRHPLYVPYAVTPQPWACDVPGGGAGRG